jgi:hypothetical protein
VSIALLHCRLSFASISLLGTIGLGVNCKLENRTLSERGTPRSQQKAAAIFWIRGLALD